LPKSGSNKPFSLWEAHSTFWNNRRFVVWQLLRRNRKYRKAIDYIKAHLSTSPPTFMAKFSFPPETKKETFGNWWIKFGVEPMQPTFFPRPLTSEEEEELFYGRIMYHAPSRPSPSLPTTEDLVRLGYKPEKLQVLNIRAQSSWNALYRSKLSLVDYYIDFPAPFFLPTFKKNPPPEKNRKAYGLYLYDIKFEPFATGKGRPRNIKDALKIWDLSTREKMKDADIARSLYGLKYKHPDKPTTLQRVHDLKRSANQAIQSIYK